LKLRNYQQKALDEIRALFSSGTKKVLLHLATGGGKTMIFCEVLKASAEKGKRAVLVVRGRKLIYQASARLDREGVDHGILMAGHWRLRPRAQIQLCSIDTIYRRKQLPEADLIVIDEAHHATSKGYKWLADAYHKAFFLPVTATPYVAGSLRHIAQDIVRPTSIKELVENKFLVPPRYYAPSVPDLTGVKTSSGDFLASDLDKILNKTHPIGDVVESWKKLSENRSTLLFAVTVKHSLAIVQAFNNAGIPAVHVDADNSDEEREQAIKKLNSGEIKIISNVGILNVGVDIPSLGCVVSVRPTKSYALYIQQMGRGTRPSPGKSDFIVIDHGGNVLRHGCILEEREGSLDPMPRSKRTTQDSLYTCSSCFAVFDRSTKECPSCGLLNPTAPSVSRENKAANPLDGKLEEADEFHLKVMARRGQLRDIAKRRNYKRGWIYYRLKEEFGQEVADKYEPKRKIPPHIRARLDRISSEIGK
jgi:DNA repair protein RadD